MKGTDGFVAGPCLVFEIPSGRYVSEIGKYDEHNRYTLIRSRLAGY